MNKYILKDNNLLKDIELLIKKYPNIKFDNKSKLKLSSSANKSSYQKKESSKTKIDKMTVKHDNIVTVKPKVSGKPPIAGIFTKEFFSKDSRLVNAYLVVLKSISKE